jgi:CO/xanthine dehydrogenase FAD-binding subunit
MITIDQYAWPATIAEADALLHGRPDAAIIGGGVFTRLTSRHIGLAIDLSRAGLDGIRETARAFEIGAMTTLRDLETDERLKHTHDGILARAASQISGVQLRNLATVGGTFYGRYPFSDLITAFLALGCTVHLHRGGAMPVAEFLALSQQTSHAGGPHGKDILTHLSIDKTASRAACQSMRITAGSLPILTVAAARGPSGMRIAVGARPGQPVLASQAMIEMDRALTERGLPTTADELENLAAQAAQTAAAEVSFADDRRATGAYRRLLCQTLVKRTILEVMA